MAYSAPVGDATKPDLPVNGALDANCSEGRILRWNDDDLRRNDSAERSARLRPGRGPVMWSRFLAGSIQRQLLLLAIGPVALIVILTQFSELLLIEDPESKLQARSVAMHIELVVDMLRAAGTEERRTAILESVNRTGLTVSEVPVSELQGDEWNADDDEYWETIVENMPLSLPMRLRERVEAGRIEHLLVVGVDDRNAFGFVAPAPVADSLITDNTVNGVLIPLALLIPSVLLSIYASRMIASPLQRFSKAANVINPDGGPDRPFEETGSSEVRALAHALNDMHARVRELVDGRTRMIRAISHDLRTPLTRLRLRAERSEEPTLRSALMTDIDTLASMIEETLVYLNKDGAGEALLKADLPSVIMTACNDFADIGHSVSYSGPERHAYICRPKQIQRAISNLIDNGTKFAESVDVELRVTAENAVIIRVSDNGPGIPATLHSSVLEPFFKLDSARSENPGFGLGLSIVQDIVHGHNGDMRLANAKPHGLIVEIHLPQQ